MLQLQSSSSPELFCRIHPPRVVPVKVDDDPEGEKLLQQDFMEQACKIVRTMVTFSALDSATHVMTYEVFSRQKKSLHCLQALRQLWELGGRDSLYYKLLAPLAHFCFVLGTEIPEQVADVVFAEIAVIIRSDEGAVPFKSAAEMKEAASKLVDAVEQKIK
ncbi:N-terminal acetyltransferase A complex auxiliary subunit NAA15 (AtNAA15) (Protein OMISHA), partial [Durusdinium trenchii]